MAQVSRLRPFLKLNRCFYAGLQPNEALNFVRSDTRAPSVAGALLRDVREVGR